MADIQTSEINAKFSPSMWDHEILYADISSDNK
jgi:hypothetical protein